MADFGQSEDKYHVNVGVRYVKTDLTVDQNAASNPNPVYWGTDSWNGVLKDFTTNSIDRSYDDVLPSVNVMYDIADGHKLRFSAAKVLPAVAAKGPHHTIDERVTLRGLHRQYRIVSEYGTFDAVGAITMRGHDEIAGMVNGAGHQGLITNGCGHVLTVPHVVIHGDEAEGRSYALNIRWDADQQRFWVARVSANTWKWRRTPDGWRVRERVNANLDGTPEHRAMLAPADAR